MISIFIISSLAISVFHFGGIPPSVILRAFVVADPGKAARARNLPIYEFIAEEAARMFPARQRSVLHSRGNRTTSTPARHIPDGRCAQW